MYSVEIDGIEINIKTDNTCFSPDGADRGTLAMLSVSNVQTGEKVLDLGCGAGIVGIWCAKITGAENVVMTDVCPVSVDFAKKNALENGVEGINIVCGDGFEKVDESDFDVILSNPPYHTDFSVAKGFIEKGFNRLKIGGRMLMVTKRLDWYKNKLTAVFGGCKVYEIDGYYVFEAKKRSMTRKDAEKKLQKKLLKAEIKAEEKTGKKVPKRFRK